jgi:hypothetical protein
VSDTNRTRLSIQRNADRLAPITLTPNELIQVRTTGQPGLASELNFVESAEIRSDRQKDDVILVGTTAGGPANFEMAFQNFDILIESALRSTYNNNTSKVGATDITAIAAGAVTVDDATDFQVGHIVRFVHVEGVTNIDNVYEVTLIAALVLTLSPLRAEDPAIPSGLTPNAATALFVAGVRAQAVGEISLVVGAGVGTITFAGASAGLLADARASASTLIVGQNIKFGQFASQTPPLDNNVYVRLSAVTATTIVFNAPSSMVTDTAAAELVEVFFGDFVRNGVEAIEDHSFALERRFLDHSPVNRELFTGMAINQVSFALPSQNLITGAFEFFGFRSAIDDVVANLYNGGTPADIDVVAEDVYNSSVDVGVVNIGGDDINLGQDDLILEGTIVINNNLRRLNAYGVFGAAKIGTGEVNVNGTLNTYFDTRTLLELTLGNQRTEFGTVWENAKGKAVAVDMPTIKFTGGAPEIPAGNTDVAFNPPYRALRDPNLDYTVHVERFQFVRD